MAVGKSHRIVIEVDPDLKEQIYQALQTRGMTLKGWFTERVMAELLDEKPDAEMPEEK